MRRRERPQAAADEIPGYVRTLDPDRYRAVAVTHFQLQPGDTWGAALAVLRAGQGEAREWYEDRDLAHRGLPGLGGPPVAWVMEEFGTPPPDFGELDLVPLRPARRASRRTSG